MEYLDLREFLDTEGFREFVGNAGLKDIGIQNGGDLVKFRRWEAHWPLPKDCEVRKEIVRYGGSRKNQKIIKRTVWVRVESVESFEIRWRRKCAPEYWGGKSKIPYEIRNGSIYIKINNNWISEVGKFEFAYQNGWLLMRVPKRYVALSYQSGDFHSNFILVPNKIKLDTEFFEGLGLQQGDGTQSLSGCHITFTNGLYSLIEHQLDWFERLGIKKASMRIYPEVPIGKEAEFRRTIKGLKKFGIRQMQIRKGKTEIHNTINVLIQIVVHNKLLKLVYLFMLFELNNKVLENRSYTASYLKGIFAAEGCVRVDSTSFLIMSVKISATSKKRRDFYKKCLKLLGIKTSKDELTKGSEGVMITGRVNFEFIQKFDLLGLHPLKKEKFEEGLKKYKRK
jgi:hypothetical protein